MRILSERGIVFVESDLRAHRNPSRMQNIGAACDELLSHMPCACPTCAAPGFGIARHEIGLPCAWCGEPTNDWKAQEFRCVICPRLESRPLPILQSLKARSPHLESAAAWALAIFRNGSETCAAVETSLQNFVASSRSGVAAISERAMASASSESPGIMFSAPGR